MKNAFKILGLLLAVATIFSCNKEEMRSDDELVVKNDSNASLSGFAVSFEGYSKATIDVDGGTVAFEDGDQVLVYIPATKKQSTYTYDNSDGLFKPASEETAISIGSNYANVYYPASEFAISEGAVSFTMPDAITAGSAADLGDKAPMAGIIPAGAVNSNGNPVATFKNLGSILRVRFNSAAADGETITGVKLDVTGANITGTGTVSWSDYTASGVPSVASLDGTTTITVETNDGHLTSSAYKDFYFFLPASGELTAMTVKAEYGKSDGTNSYFPYETISRTSSMTLARNQIFTVSKTLNGFFAGGDGSATYPYLISAADQFKAISTLANYTTEGDAYYYNTACGRTFFGSAGVNYKQTAEIDLEDAAVSSIGVYTSIPFCGVYDGGEFALKNFSVTGTADGSTGLFEYVSDATLKNITISNATVTAPNTGGILTGRCIGATTIDNCKLTTGAITGRNSVGFIAHITGTTTVTDCQVSNLTITTASTGDADANNQGGVIGFDGSTGNVSGCSTSGYITFNGTASGNARGGIIGKLNAVATVSNCTNAATVTNELVQSTGGIMGWLCYGTITGCVNTGNVTGLAKTGGIVGLMGNNADWVYVNNCRVNAAVSGAGQVGGVVGNMYGGVLNTCSAKGSVTASGYDVGGIVGQMYCYNATWGRQYTYDCLAANDVTCTRTSGSANLGGVIGRIVRNKSITGQYMAVDNCIGLNQTLNAGELPYVGAFVGNVTSTVTTNANRVRVRNCVSLVTDSNLASSTSTTYKGGFAGSILGLAYYCFYVAAENSQTILDGSDTSNVTKTDAATIATEAFCTDLNSRSYTLTVGSSYTSEGWTLPSGGSYPVPTSLYNLGTEYYQ